MFSEFFLERPRFAIVLSIVMCIAGAVALTALPIALYPEITPPVVTVSAMYPGANADVVAKTVAIPIEKEVNGVEDMLYMESSSEDSSYTLTVTFKTGVDPDIAQVKVQNRVQIASASLPQEVTRQGVTVSRESTNMLGVISFTSPKGTISKLELADYIKDNVKEALARLNGIGGISIYASSSSMRVWLNADRMASLNIPVAEVTAAIASQNYQPTLGKLGAAPNEQSRIVYALKTQGRINEVEDFREIVIRTADHGGLVKLKDIAQVEYGEESYGITGYDNNVPAVTLMIKLSSGANALETMERVKNELRRLEAYFSEDLSYKFNYDSTDYIHASVEEVVMTLAMTFFLVILVCYLFLQDVRTTLVPTLTIPVSLLSTFAVMLALGYSINMFTLFGLVLAIGVVVDDAIVVVERVMHLMTVEKMNALAATRRTMKEVSAALVATAFILVAIFLPIACMSGITGRIYQQFAITICTAIVFSALNALTLSPVLCAYMLKPFEPPRHGPFAWFNALLNRVTSSYARVTALFARKIGIIALLFALILGLNGFLFKVSETSFIPGEDQGMFIVNILLPEGASINRTKEVVDKIIPQLNKEEGVRGTLSVIGISMLAGRSENVAMIFVDLENWSKRKKPELYSSNIVNKIRSDLPRTLPEAELQFFEMPAIPGLGNQNGLDFRLQSLNGTDYEKLDDQTRKMLGLFNREPSILYAFTTFTSQTPNLFLIINRDKAESLNVPLSNLYSTLESYLGSTYVNDINIGTQVNKVVVQSSWEYRKDTDSLNSLYVPSSDGKMIPLGSLLDVRKVLSPRVITRYNQYPSATITAVPPPAVSSGAAMAALEQLAAAMPKTFSFEWSGMSYQEKNNQGQLAVLILLAVTFAYLFLVAQYESWTLPISVLMSVSVATMGALAGLYLTGLPLSIYAQLGVVLLIGLASKNAILIVEFAREERLKRKSIVSSALFALRERFRAVLMTAFTFVLGVWPMIVATGAGANSRRAIGVPVFYGMLIGTAVGLFIIPLLYVLVQTLTEMFSKRAGAK